MRSVAGGGGGGAGAVSHVCILKLYVKGTGVGGGLHISHLLQMQCFKLVNLSTGINCNYFQKNFGTTVTIYNQFENSTTCWEIYTLNTQPINAHKPERLFSGKILERKTIFQTPQVNKQDSSDWLSFHFVPSTCLYSGRVAFVYLQWLEVITAALVNWHFMGIVSPLCKMFDVFTGAVSPRKNTAQYSYIFFFFWQRKKKFLVSDV